MQKPKGNLPIASNKMDRPAAAAGLGYAVFRPSLDLGLPIRGADRGHHHRPGHFPGRDPGHFHGSVQQNEERIE